MVSPELWEEIKRLRDRTDKHGDDLAAILHVVALLEQWRHVHQREADRMHARIEELWQDETTKRAVALALKRRSRLHLSWAQRVVAAVVAIPALYDVGHIVGLY